MLCDFIGIAIQIPPTSLWKAISGLTDPLDQKEIEMQEQREILKQEVVDLVKNFVETEGGITMFDLQLLFGNAVESVGCNEVFTAMRLNGFDKMDRSNGNHG